jgi:outer membrane protein assembly factor BamB
LGPGVTDGKTVYFASSDYGTVAVDAATRTERWRGAPGNAVSVRPVLSIRADDGGPLIVQCADDGIVTALDAKTGSPVAEIAVGGKPATKVAWLPGTKTRPARVFVNCDDGVLRTRVVPER